MCRVIVLQLVPKGFVHCVTRRYCDNACLADRTGKRTHRTGGASGCSGGSWKHNDCREILGTGKVTSERTIFALMAKYVVGTGHE